MSIMLDETVRAIIFAPFADTADIMFAIKEEKTGGFTSEGRLRFYGKSHGDPFLDEDRKKWFTGKHPSRTLDEVIEKLGEAISQLEMISAITGFRKKGEEMTVLRRGDGQSLDDFMDDFLKQPWAHHKILS